MRKSVFAGWAELDIAAIRARRERELTLWQTLRYLDTTAVGIVSYCPQGSTERKTLARGTGIFWTRTHDGRRQRVFLRGTISVARALGVSSLQASYLGPLEWLRERRRGVLRARLGCNAIAVLRDGRPIAVKTAAHMLGIGERTFQLWMSRTGWRRIPSLSLLGRLRDPDGVRVLARKYGGRLRVAQIDGAAWLVERLPNVLEPQANKTSRKAARRRINKALASCDLRGRGQHPRLYFIPDARRPTPTRSYPYRLRRTKPSLTLWERTTNTPN
jgi:hypothetical protein